MANRIYCISGLGADHRIFGKLHIPGYELIHVPWLPYAKDDTLPAYARKLFSFISDEQAIIIGVSFGGMLAVELARLFPGCKVYIISSAKRSNELGMPKSGVVPWIVKNRLLPAWALTIPNPLLLHYFGAVEQEDKQLLSSIIRESDGGFMKWAFKAMLLWPDKNCPENVLHVHGTADKIIPSEHVHPDVWIEDGTHIMVYNRAGVVSKIITDHLKDGVNLPEQ